MYGPICQRDFRIKSPKYPSRRQPLARERTLPQRAPPEFKKVASEIYHHLGAESSQVARVRSAVEAPTLASASSYGVLQIRTERDTHGHRDAAGSCQR